MSIDFPDYSVNVPLMSDTNWKSDSSFTYKLISSVYDVANKNLDGYFKDYKYMKSFHIHEEDILDLSYWENDTDVNDIIHDNLGSAIYIGVWTVLAIIFTIIGIVWCACNKCCCCCGRKTNDLDFLVSTDPDDGSWRLRLEGYNKKHEKKKLIKKVVVGVFMGFGIIGLSFSVFMSFASNESLRKSIFEFYDDVTLALDDAEEYIAITNQQLTGVFITSFDNLADEIVCPPGLDHLNQASKSQESCEELRKKTERFLEAIGHYRNEVEPKSEVDDDALGGLGHSLEKLRNILVEKVDPFFNLLANEGHSMQNTCEAAIGFTGERLQNDANILIDALNNVPISDFRDDINDAENDFLDIVGSAVYGSFMGFNVILLMILIGVAVGSVITWIGKGSAKKTGFMFYRFAIVLMFVFGWIVVLTMLVQFEVAGFFTKVACVAVRDLENNSSSISKSAFRADGDDTYIVPSYGHVMNLCKNDVGAFGALKLDQVYDVESLRNISDNFDFIRNPMWTPDEFFIKHVYSMNAVLTDELRVFQSYKTRLSEAVNETIYSRTEYLIISIMEHLKQLENGDMYRDSLIYQTNNKELIENYEEFAFTQIAEEVGRCKPLYSAVNATIHTVCYKLLVPVATYWWALQLLSLLFVVLISTALISERVFK